MKRADKKSLQRKELRIINRIMLVFFITVILLLLLSFIHFKKQAYANELLHYDNNYATKLHENKYALELQYFDDSESLSNHIQEQIIIFYNKQADYERLLSHQANLLSSDGIIKERREKAMFHKELILQTLKHHKIRGIHLPNASEIESKLGNYVYVEL